MKYNNFTVLIPTMNRHDYMKRSIEYFKNINAKTIYCDSSSKQYSDTVPYNVTYLHLPDKNFPQKILCALDLVKTDFVALCADDDFIFADSLYSGVDLLEKNNQFRTIIGNNIFFYDIFDGKFYKKNTFLNEDINFDKVINVVKFFKNYDQILWRLYHKDILIKSFKIIQKANFCNDNFIEMVLGTIAAYFGGIKYIDEIWSIREISQQNHWGKRHKPIYHLEDINIQNDFFAMKKYLDPQTSTGISKIAITSYFCFIQKRFEMTKNNHSALSQITSEQLKSRKDLIKIKKNIATIHCNNF